MVLLDLFSGTGGFALGFQKAGFVFEKHYFSEIDKHAIANYQYNFPKAIYAGSVETIDPKKIQRPDLITFGFPCQDLSVAGQRKGLSGKRSGLFFQALRLIRELKPRVFIFENVKGLFSSQEGKDFETILKEIAHLGLYNCQWQLLNTSWFLPQNRERIYFVGCLREKGSPQIFPFTQSDFGTQKSGEKKTQTQISPTIDTQVAGSHYSPYVVKKNKSKGINNKMARYDQLDLNGKGNSSQHNRIYRTEFSGPTLTTRGSEQCKIYDFSTIRRLTPVECERLQGFPDNWSLHGNYNGEIKEISDTQRYRLMGNAVSVPVVVAIANRFVKTKNKKKNNLLNSLQGTRQKMKTSLTTLCESTATDFAIPEILLTYKRNDYQKDSSVNSSNTAARIFRNLYPKDTIQLQEQFYVLLLNRSLRIIGSVHISTGGITGTVADIRLILATALKSASTAIMICHNHPSGAVVPSDADIVLTKRIKEACRLMDIEFLDHIILGDKEEYYSFADRDNLGTLDELKKYTLPLRKRGVKVDMKNFKYKLLSLKAKALALELALLQFAA